MSQEKIIENGFLFYRLNSQELDFIINYEIKYRMGRDVEDSAED